MIRGRIAVKRYCDDQLAIVFEHAPRFSQRIEIIPDVFEHFSHQHRVKRLVGEWSRAGDVCDGKPWQVRLARNVEIENLMTRSRERIEIAPPRGTNIQHALAAARQANNQGCRFDFLN